ncbi:MAG TPA: phosphoribosylformylglycinamidine synthase subunit PurL [Candidatus Dormibacteraeota bacterium]|jgi:phosphoribosylformylglycinamidine synthase|nr:phosphoribosylformylglycinamidine synthase subunit PurL [Candidatus Dormibacteraeota bacterium]
MAVALRTAQLRAVALTDDEFGAIVRALGREPNDLELGMLGALWSEHCSYKTSKALLRQLPTEGPHVLQGPGENAGAVDIGDGLAVVFKIESHNHPSAIEPYQGAATGVGGILRDVFAMGARPIALLDALRFGPLDQRRNRHLFQGVVAGIGGYGNCFGCPTVGGEVYFDPAYSENPIVNAMCVGLVSHQGLRRARADRAGDVVLLVGADTGRDGIQGATFASVEMDQGSAARRPAVQVGNPFLEKLLCEACLVLNELEGVTAIQDLGAAGLTSAASELAHRGRRGIDLDVDRVSRREDGMNAYEVMLSESQERMLVVVRPGAEAAARAVVDRFELHADRVGAITGTGRIRVREGGTVVADLPLKTLVDGVPPRSQKASSPERPPSPPMPSIAEPEAILLDLLSSANLRSRRPIYRTYDHQVQDNTVVGPGFDAALLRVPGTRKGLALTTDGNPWYVALDAYEGTKAAVAEAARNIVCTGARPLAVTNCLNFGNPQRPVVFGQLQESVRGLADACRAFGLPVVSGNVSLYNETSERNILPTPVVGMVGLLDDLASRCPAGFQEDGDLIFLLGETGEELAGSQYLQLLGARLEGRPPAVNLEIERRLQVAMLESIAAGVLRSAHDVSDGGLLVALAESALFGGRGLRCPSIVGPVTREAFLFGESQARVIVSVAPRRVPELQRLMLHHHLPLHAMGVVGGEDFQVGVDIRLSLDTLRQAWETPF